MYVCVRVCVCTCVCVSVLSLFRDNFKHDSVVLEGWSTREGRASMDVKRHGSMTWIVLSRVTIDNRDETQ